jgi:hypothetical protein
MARNSSEVTQITGVGQLSLVEHALCPLDSKASLTENLVFATRYSYTNTVGKRSLAQARVFSPLGLSASDEFYLWGLLALTFQQPDPRPELIATPHWFLRQLGVINPSSRRGGRQYKQFADALRRLSVVTYMNDAFYDPVKTEHRRVSFGLFSYSLPEDVRSSRAWRIAWDPIFFDMVHTTAGHFHFDLAVYRELDPATRRLFLFVSKIFYRRPNLKAIRLDQLGVDMLGFSDSVQTRDLKVKVDRCLRKLCEFQVLANATIYRTSPGKYYVRMSRGVYFRNQTREPEQLSPTDSPMMDTLRAIGFDDEPAVRLICRFRRQPLLLTEWCDITQAAIERFGPDYFHNSPMAFLVDSVDKASKGNRTAPDWWCELKRSESHEHEFSQESENLFAKIRDELFSEKQVSEKPDSSAVRNESLTRISDVFSDRS